MAGQEQIGKDAPRDRAAMQVHLNAALATVDYRDPDALRTLAAQVGVLIGRAEQILDEKRRELGIIQAAIASLAGLRAKVLDDARYLHDRAGFEQANATRIEGKGPSPEIPA